MRLGFFLGFLIGAGVASVLGLERQRIPPDSTDSVTGETEASAEGVIASVRRKVREAITAGKEAATEKEAQMRREYEETTGHRP